MSSQSYAESVLEKGSVTAFRTLLTGGLLLLSGCGGESSAPAPDRLEQLFAGSVTVVDLTHPLSADMPYWPNPNGNPFRHDTLRAHEDGSPSMAAYTTPEHHGTHLDAPVHGAEGGRSVDELTTADLWGPAAVVDVTAHADVDPDYRLSMEDLEAWESEHGPIPQGAIVILRTGWATRWDQPSTYYGADADGTLHFPGFSVEVAHFLVEERTIRGLGIDDGSVDHGPSRDFPVHGIVHGAGKFHLENLGDLSALPATGAQLIVAPVKIEGGSGGQVRVYALLP